MTKNVLENINEVFANNEEIIIVLHIDGFDFYGNNEFGFDEYDAEWFENEFNLSKYNVTSVEEDIENNEYHIYGI